MIILYSAGEGFGLPEVSPYVTKTEVQLRMAGLPYLKEPAAPHLSPKGQLPWIDDHGTVVADSTFIRAHLEKVYAFDLDEGLSAAERGQAWAIERMVENHLGWTGAWARFFIPENFDRGPAHWFDWASPRQREDLCHDLLEQVQTNLKAVGIGRHSNAEIVELGVTSLQALSSMLGDKPYLFGARPAGVDAIVFATLAQFMTPFFDSELRRRAEGFGNLVGYVDRMMARYYPEFAWKPVMKQAA